MTLYELIDHLDGWGLVVDNEDLVAEGLWAVGLTFDTEIPREKPNA